MYESFEDRNGPKELGYFAIGFILLYILLNSISNLVMAIIYFDTKKRSKGSKWFLGINIAKSSISVVIFLFVFYQFAFKKKRKIQYVII